jgi:UV excision repair protein RAD23
VSQLKDMGFPESEVRTALRAAFGSTERAADFLMSGSIPASAIAAADAAARGGGAPPAVPRPPAAGGGSGAPAAAGGALAQLRAHPQINDMRRLVQGNPGALQSLLAQIGSQSPALLSLITANQAEFLAILSEPTTDEEGDEEDEEGGGEGMDEDDEEGEGGSECDAHGLQVASIACPTVAGRALLTLAREASGEIARGVNRHSPAALLRCIHAGAPQRCCHSILPSPATAAPFPPPPPSRSCPRAAACGP